MRSLRRVSALKRLAGSARISVELAQPEIHQALTARPAGFNNNGEWKSHCKSLPSEQLKTQTPASFLDASKANVNLKQNCTLNCASSCASLESARAGTSKREEAQAIVEEQLPPAFALHKQQAAWLGSCVAAIARQSIKRESEPRQAGRL